MNGRRVVVTGIGVASPIGMGFEAFRAGLLAGRCGVAPITHFDASRARSRVAAEVAGYDDEMLPTEPRYNVVLGRPMRLGLVAAAEALANARLDRDSEARARAACLMAIGRYEFNLDEFGSAFARSLKPDPEGGYAFDRYVFRTRGARSTHPMWLLKFIPNLAVAHIVRTFGMQGEANTYTTEAAAGLQVLADAAESIREGRYDVALCGAADSRLTPLGVARYAALGLLAEGGPEETAVSRPFDRARRGYVLGEGAVFFVLEALEHAERRGASPLAEVSGWGGASDAHHPYRAHPEGRGLRGSMSAAMRVAGAAPSDVDLVVATAASLPDLDSAEAAALRDVFREGAPAVTAPAGAIGRAHTAAGAFGAAAAIVAISEQAIPPTVNTTHPAEDAPRHLVIGEGPRRARVRAVVANAFSFGGQCASVLIREVAS